MSKTKIASAVLGLAMVFAVTAAPVKAQTIAELQALVNQLMAQIAALQGGTTVTTGTYNFTQNLTIGSTGGDVTSLQMFLVSKGHLNMPTGVAYGYFGPLTRSAVAAWQAANGISPAVGYWGPLSRAKANTQQSTGTTTGGTTVGGSTQVGITTPGVEGTLTVTETSVDTEDEISEGDSKVSVLGLELEADLSDIKVERIEIQLGTDKDIYRDIASKIYVMDGNTVLASRDLNSSTVIENSAGTLVVTLSGMNFIVKKGMEENITIAFDAMSNIDTADNGTSWTVTIPMDGVRGVDGAGINQYGPDSAISESFTVEAVTAGDLDITEANENPDAQVVNIHEENNTDNVLVLAFDLEADDQDLVIDAIPVGLVVTENEGVDGPVRRAILKHGSTVLDTVSIPSTAGTSYEVVFDNLDFDIDEGDTETFMVYVDLNDADVTTFATGTTLYATTTGSAAAWDVEDANGDDVTPDGSVDNSGQVLTFQTEGISADLTSSSVSSVLNLDSTSSDDQGMFVMEFTVTAFEDTAYIPLTAASSTSANASDIGVAFGMESASDGTSVQTGTTTATLARVSGGSETGGYVKINAGQTATLRLTVYHDAAATGIYRVQMDSIGFNDTQAAPDSEYNTVPASDFESSSIQILN